MLEIERTVVREGMRAAARVAPEVVTDSPLHPQHVVARVTEVYLSLIEASTRPAMRQGATVLALISLAVLLWRTIRVHKHQGS